MQQHVKQPPSPTPTIILDSFGKLLEDYKQAKERDHSNAVPPPPSVSNKVDVCKTELPKQLPSTHVDLCALSKFLPTDPKLQTKVVSDLIQYYANAGRLDCISNFAEKPELLTSWRNPSGTARNAHEQVFQVTKTGIDTRMTTTDWNSIFGTSNQTNGRCVRLMPAPASSSITQDRWARYTDTIRMKELSVNLMITPTINLTGSTPPLMDAEQQVVECMVIVDQFALMSNPFGGLGQAVGMVDTSTDQFEYSDSPNTVFTLPLGAGTTPPTGVFAYSCMQPNLLTKDTRFRILMHKKMPIKYFSNWIETTDNKCVQTPGECQFHQFTVPLDFVAPFTQSSDVEPYINNCYFLIWGNTSTTITPNYYSIVHFDLRVSFKDIGNQ